VKPASVIPSTWHAERVVFLK